MIPPANTPPTCTSRTFQLHLLLTHTCSDPVPSISPGLQMCEIWIVTHWDMSCSTPGLPSSCLIEHASQCQSDRASHLGVLDSRQAHDREHILHALF